jgi:hypothetical protein
MICGTKKAPGTTWQRTGTEDVDAYRIEFADYEHHDYQEEVVEARHAKTVMSFIWDVNFVNETWPLTRLALWRP